MSSIDGLITGMATTDIINQLLQLERQPVVRLQAKKATNDKVIAALQALNTKFASLKDLATKFDPTKWSAATSTSSHPNNVGVYAAPGTAPTTMTLQVNAIAAAHTERSSLFAGPATAIADAGQPITLSYLDTNGAATSVTITNHDGTAQGIRDAIEATDVSPVSAEIVADGAEFRLELTAKKTGEFSRFDVSNLIKTNGNSTNTVTTTFSTTALGMDAEIVQGTGEFAKVTKSTTNVFDIAEGITVSLKQALPGQDITLTTTEASKPADEVEKIVEAANAILKEIKTLTGYDAGAKKGGLLQGNSLMRSLQSAVVSAAIDAVGGDSAFEAGLQITRTGELEFDKAKFEAAYAADPAQVSAILKGDATTPGLVERLGALATEVTLTGTGRLTTAIESRRSEIRRLDDSIATWDARLIRREAALRRQFAAMETALGRSQQQGNWLAGQISSLPGMMTN